MDIFHPKKKERGTGTEIDHFVKRTKESRERKKEKKMVLNDIMH
jgi:hypothetical protein